MKSNRSRIFALAMATLVLSSGCFPGGPAVSAGGQPVAALARNARATTYDVLQGVDQLPNGNLRPRIDPQVQIPAPEVPRAPSQVEVRAGQLLAPHAAGLNKEQLIRVASVACYANTLYGLSQEKPWPDAINEAVKEFGGNATFALRVESLAEDLNKAAGATDYITKLAVFAICESVG